jgi:cytochrome c peroxidase
MIARHEARGQAVIHNGVSGGRDKVRPAKIRRGAVAARIASAHSDNPYMHDGSIASLEEVIEFYNRGGQPNASLDPTIRPLNLSKREKSDLIAVLRSLSAGADAGAEPRPRAISPITVP